MPQLLLDSFASSSTFDRSTPSGFLTSSALLGRQLAWLFWANAIDTCTEMFGEKGKLICPEDPYVTSDSQTIAMALRSMRAPYSPRLLLQDERSEIVPLGSDACTVLFYHHIQDASESAGTARRQSEPDSFLCSTTWSRTDDDDCALALCQWSGFSSPIGTNNNAASDRSRTPAPISTLGNSVEQSGQKAALQARGTDGVTHWFQPESIIYVAAAHQYTDIYCTDRRLRLRASIASITEQLSSVVVRVHRSYAVNPAYISRFEQDSLYLTTGVRIPIPAKRLREVRLMLQEHFNKLGKRD